MSRLSTSPLLFSCVLLSQLLHLVKHSEHCGNSSEYLTFRPMRVIRITDWNIITVASQDSPLAYWVRVVLKILGPGLNHFSGTFGILFFLLNSSTYRPTTHAHLFCVLD
uniref:Putative secreted protein n=1 Tax=Ixodes ricinus TaxID=34613 RepID=A0A6B0UCJ8_IXORI